MKLKPHSSDETRIQLHLRLGLEPTVTDLGGDSNPLSLNETTHLVSGLIEAQVVLSRHRKNSAGGKETGKE